jgi:hypothetical protein
MGLEQTLHCVGDGSAVGITGKLDPDAKRPVVDQIDFRPLDPIYGGQGPPQVVLHSSLRCRFRHRR